MSKERDIDQWIDDYLLGRLDKGSEQQFRKRLEGDEAFAKLVALRKEMQEGIEAFGRKDLKETLKNIHQEVTSTPVKAKNKNSLLSLIAVVLIITFLAGLAWWWMNANKKQASSPEQLYLAYFEPYLLTDIRRSDSKEALFRLQELYNEQKYTEALPLIQGHLDSLVNQPSDWLLAAGISALELNKTGEALRYFEQITNNGDFNFKDEVHWYRALAYLKSGDPEKAGVTLQSLLEDKSADHHKEAVELMEKLNK